MPATQTPAKPARKPASKAKASTKTSAKASAAEKAREGKRAEAKARTEAHKDQALAFLRKRGGHAHAKDIQAELKLSDADGDRLYLAMKDDDRFVKGQPRIASYTLTPKGKRVKIG